MKILQKYLLLLGAMLLLTGFSAQQAIANCRRSDLISELEQGVHDAIFQHVGLHAAVERVDAGVRKTRVASAERSNRLHNVRLLVCDLAVMCEFRRVRRVNDEH